MAPDPRWARCPGGFVRMAASLGSRWPDPGLQPLLQGPTCLRACRPPSADRCQASTVVPGAAGSGMGTCFHGRPRPLLPPPSARRCALMGYVCVCVFLFPLFWLQKNYVCGSYYVSLKIYLFSHFKINFFFYWRIVDLQCCVSFRCERESTTRAHTSICFLTRLSHSIE